MTLQTEYGQPLIPYGYWVNGTAASLYNFDAKDTDTSLIPPATFPFPRISTLASSNGTVPIYLYHQINGTVFSELFYDSLIKSWVVTNIDVTKLSGFIDAA